MWTLQVLGESDDLRGVFCKGDEPRKGDIVVLKEPVNPLTWTVESVSPSGTGFVLVLTGHAMKPAPGSTLNFDR